MKIGILGSGIVGKTLASGFIEHGYDVMVGTRDTSKLEEWKAKVNGKGRVGSFEDAAAFGDMVVLAVKGHAAMDVLKMAGRQNFNGKPVIDATNPIDEKNPPEDGVLNFFTTLKESLMEQLQNAYPEAHFVKAFNSVGSAYMVNPSFEDGTPTMFICGNDAAAKTNVTNVLRLFGFEVEDMGGVKSARAIEPLCILWCIPGMLNGQWSHAFKLLKK